MLIIEHESRTAIVNYYHYVNVNRGVFMPYIRQVNVFIIRDKIKIV